MLKTLCICFVLISTCSIGFTDFAVIEYNLISGTVYPVFNEDIQLVEEEIKYKTIKRREPWVADCKFIFLNTTAKKIEIDIGFPVSGDIDEFVSGMKSRRTGNYPKDTPTRQIIKECFNFKCFDNDKEIPCLLKKASGENKFSAEYSYFFVSRITFNAHEEKTIKCTYNQKIHYYDESSGIFYGRQSYILKTKNR